MRSVAASSRNLRSTASVCVPADKKLERNNIFAFLLSFIFLQPALVVICPYQCFYYNDNITLVMARWRAVLVSVAIVSSMNVLTPKYSIVTLKRTNFLT